MARGPLLALLALCWLPTAGCAAWPWALREAAQPDQAVVSPAGEDGTRYVAVEGGPLASPAGLRSRWSAVARQACDGEYTPISEASASRRQGGITRGRVHEGYIRCMLPEPSELGAGPTVEDATAKRPSRSRRDRSANLARTRWAR